ncbi:MAG: tyrosine-type recombinase/integrase [Stackebrandtia sp.]
MSRGLDVFDFNPAREASLPAADAYRAYLDSLTHPTSRREMAACLDRIARLSTDGAADTGQHQPWHLLEYKHTSAIKALLCRQGWSPAYVNKHLSALRRVLEEAWKLGLMSLDAKQRACQVEDLKRVRMPAGRHVAAEDVAAVLAACDADDSPAGARDAAIIAALYSTGCRRAEVAALNFTDYDPGERSLTVLGKRDKQRLVHLNPAADARLAIWLAVRGGAPGALFSPVSKAGRIRMRQGLPASMSGQAVAQMLARRLRGAGLAEATPHDFRRTFIGEMLDAGVDLATTQEIVGHDSPATTVRYDRRPVRRRREAVDRLRLPEVEKPA